MVVKFLKKLLNMLEKNQKIELSPEEKEFVEKQKRIKQDFQKMMSYNVAQATAPKK